MNKFTIEFWPGKTFTVESEWDEGQEDNILADYIANNGWPGFGESTAGGVRFVVWVKKVNN